VFGHRAATALAAGRTGPEPTGAMRGVPLEGASGPAAPPPFRRSSVPPPGTEERPLWVAQLRDRLQRDMTTFAGVLRDGPGLDRATGAVAAVASAFAGTGAAAGSPSAADDVLSAAGRDAAELRTLLAVATAVVAAAAERHES